MKNQTLRIGQVAEKSGLKYSTVRFYVREGLLPYKQDSRRAYLWFDEEETMKRLKQIGQMARDGMTIKEMKQVLGVIKKRAKK